MSDEDSSETEEKIYRKLSPLPRRQSPFGLSVIVPPHDDSHESNTSGDAQLDDPIDLKAPSSGLGVDTPTAATFERITKLPTPIIKQGLFSSAFSGNSLVMSSSPGTVGATSPSTLSPVQEESNMLPLNRELKPYRAISEYKPSAVVRKSSLWDTAAPAMQPPAVSGKRVVSTPTASKFNEGTPPVEEESVAAKSRQDEIYVAPHTGKKYAFQQEIGRGSFSTVVLAINVEDPSDKIAVKIIQVPLTSERETFNFKAVIRRELNTLNSIKHPCLVSVFDYAISIPLRPASADVSDLDPDADLDGAPVSASAISQVYNALREKSEQYLFLTYSRGGNLYQFQYENRIQCHTLGYWQVIRRITAELICAVSHLHSHGIVHRDIKLENILINASYPELVAAVDSKVANDHSFINLTDFGLSRRLRYEDEFLVTRCGSQDYVSPELLLGIPYDGKLTDSWAVGVVIYALLENRLPFDVPPVTALLNGISPLVLKRRRNKNTAAHRIAMLNWDWYTVLELSDDEKVPQPAKGIIIELKEIVEKLLVRKDRRSLVSTFRSSSISQCVPASFLQ